MTAAYRRYRHAAEVKREVDKLLVGTTFHLPLLETEQRQQFRQRSDYEELIQEFYASPSPVDSHLASDTLTYRITGVDTWESFGFLYKLNRIAGRTEFDGGVKLDLDFEDDSIPPLSFSHHPWYDDLELRIDHYHRGSEMTLYHEYTDLDTLASTLWLFNEILATLWETPQTIPELVEDAAKWEGYNRFKEEFR